MKHFEFWHPRLFEAPYYAYLLARSALKGMGPRQLPKANYALDHGELGLGSKYSTQLKFDQSYFPATVRLDFPLEDPQPLSLFVAQVGYPIIIKPENGAVGKAVYKVNDATEQDEVVAGLSGSFLVQAYCTYPEEFGVFYVKKQGIQRITGINQKHFPTVIGDGVSTLEQLAANHPRRTHHWQLFLKHLDLSVVPEEGESVRLSFVGSHTMGCKFTNDTGLVTRKLEKAIYRFCDSEPGFHFGRLDVRSESVETFQAGEFMVMEVNGIASLPTHMFDPDGRLIDAYRIFLEHGRHLVDAAYENRHRQMHIDSIGVIWERAKRQAAELNEAHHTALNQ